MQVGCTINYGRKVLWKETEEMNMSQTKAYDVRDSRARLSLRAQLDALTIPSVGENE